MFTNSNGNKKGWFIKGSSSHKTPKTWKLHFFRAKNVLMCWWKKSVPLPDFAVDMFSSSEAVVLVDFFRVLYWWLFIPPIPFVCSTYLLYWVTELSCLSLTALRG